MEPFRYFDPDFVRAYETRGKSIRLAPGAATTADLHVIQVQ
ncbi:MAG TPA: hypothetical protein VFR05_05780 [Terriglobia bacterium]|nr:hypothetical protein [Terriglobia bacterium]